MGEEGHTAPNPTSPSSRGPCPTRAHLAGDVTALACAACDVTIGPRGVLRVRARKKPPLAGARERPDEKGYFQAVSAQVVRWVRAPARGAGCYGRSGCRCLARAGSRGRGVAGVGAARPRFLGFPRSVATFKIRQHYEASKEGIPPQNTYKQILGGRRKHQRLALAALGAAGEPSRGRGLGWESRQEA